MCLDLSQKQAIGVNTGFNIFGGLLSIFGANDEEKAARKLAKKQRAIAEQNALDEYGAIGRRESEEAEAAAAEIADTSSQARQLAGAATASAAAGGVGGRSIGELVAEYERQAAASASRTLFNKSARSRSLNDARKQVRSQLAAQLVNATPPPRRNTILPTAISAASSSLGFAAQVGAFKK